MTTPDHKTEDGTIIDYKTKAQHTPGPWRIAAHYVVGPEGDAVANCDASNLAPDVQDANARLIAAAPDLLAFAKEFVRVMESPKTTVAMPHTVAQAKAAIAKAEGQTTDE